MWKDELLPCSYNGVIFYIDSESLDFGRRLQTNQYPFSDTPNTTNLGRKARKYTLNAYVIGDDYILVRNALLDMIEQTNIAGLLTLPTLAPVLVYPTDECQQVFNNKEGGRETFKLVFVEAGVNLFPSIGNNTQLQADLAYAGAAVSIFEDFKNRFNTGSFPSFIGGDAQSKAGDFVNLINLASQTGVVSQNDFSDFNAKVNAFSSSISTIITDPDAIGSGIKDLVEGLTNLYDNPNDAYNAQKQLTNYGANYIPIIPTTASLQQQLDNQNALVNIVKNSALVQMCASTINMTFDSRQDALATRDEISQLVKTQLFELGDQRNDAQFKALTDALVKMVSDIDTRSATLKNIQYVSITDSIPAIVFAYNNYGTADAEADVIARNNVQNPLFLPSGSTLEVLK
jgi:prophage DNA circulation protein